MMNRRADILSCGLNILGRFANPMFSPETSSKVAGMKEEVFGMETSGL